MGVVWAFPNFLFVLDCHLLLLRLSRGCGFGLPHYPSDMGRLVFDFESLYLRVWPRPARVCTSSIIASLLIHLKILVGRRSPHINVFITTIVIIIDEVHNIA